MFQRAPLKWWSDSPSGAPRWQRVRSGKPFRSVAKNRAGRSLRGTVREPMGSSSPSIAPADASRFPPRSEVVRSMIHPACSPSPLRRGRIHGATGSRIRQRRQPVRHEQLRTRRPGRPAVDGGAGFGGGDPRSQPGPSPAASQRDAAQSARTPSLRKRPGSESAGAAQSARRQGHDGASRRAGRRIELGPATVSRRTRSSPR